MAGVPSYGALRKRGVEVFSNIWEGGVGSYGSYVYRLGDEYYRYDGFEEEVDGPFATLLDALEGDIVAVTSGTVSIDSTELTYEEIIPLLRPDDTAEEEILVNDRDWQP